MACLTEINNKVDWEYDDMAEICSCILAMNLRTNKDCCVISWYESEHSICLELISQKDSIVMSLNDKALRLITIAAAAKSENNGLNDCTETALKNIRDAGNAIYFRLKSIYPVVRDLGMRKRRINKNEVYKVWQRVQRASGNI